MAKAKNDKVAADLLSKIERVPIGKLKPDEKNPRSHDEKNIRAIRDSLLRYGQVEPLVVQRSSGMVIGGNGRLEAFKRMGATEVDVVYVDLDDVEARRLSIALNRTSELARWDDDNLKEALRLLAETTPEIVIPGFDAADIRMHLADQAEFLSTFLGKGGGGSPEASPPTDKGPTTDPGGRVAYVDLVLSLTPEDRASVYRILQKVKETRSLKTSSDALIEVFRHYERTAL